jgi:2-polyprenyl-3-methyl-5-hydroxy-6-metoxy-1,4-benzoquinol methylase
MIKRWFSSLLAALKRLLTLPFRTLEQVHRLRAELSTYSTASVESVSYLGAELRSLSFSLNEQLPKLIEEVSALRQALEREGHVELDEEAFVLRSLEGIETPARVLQVGAGDGGLASSLVSLGHEVTVLDPEGSPVEDSRVKVISEPLEDWKVQPGSFDAILCASVIDRASLERLMEMLTAEGRLVLGESTASATGIVRARSAPTE